MLASLGCGNPTALAELEGGRDRARPRLRRRHRRAALRPPRRPHGQSLRPRHDRRHAGAGAREPAKGRRDNVEFLKGEIEHIPLPDNSVDVIISNCVINLSADKDRVLREAFRVLRPGGRFAVSDVVTRGAVPEQMRRDMLLWAGCIAGALDETTTARGWPPQGSRPIGIEPTRVYDIEDAREFLAGKGSTWTRSPPGRGKFMSAFVRATKPGIGRRPPAAPRPAAPDLLEPGRQ